MNALVLKGTRSSFGMLSKVAPELGVRTAARLFSTPKSRPVSPEERAVRLG